ncbi:MAG TPA: zinc ribbon domain-containing protein [Labilithrix sp.]|nr:zinc ribbon domain-containing protein [Labilithrix sp.]
MPTYEYVCTGCQNQWEEIQKISESAVEVCPKCGQSTAKRQISGGNFILKGGGWYADLYSSSPKKGDSKSESGAASKTESAPAAKAEASSSTSSASGSSGATASTGSSGSSK